MADDNQKRIEAALMVAGAGATIRDRFNDAKRPDWESYKKANQAKMEGTNEQDLAMEEYRRQLDKERDDKLSRGRNREKKKKKKKKRDDSSSSDDDDDDSDSSSSSDDKKRKKRKKKHHKKKRSRRKRDSDSSSSSDDDSEDSDQERKRKRRKKKHKRRRDKKGSSDEDVNKEHYRLSTFFNEGDDEEWNNFSFITVAICYVGDQWILSIQLVSWWDFQVLISCVSTQLRVFLFKWNLSH